MKNIKKQDMSYKCQFKDGVMLGKYAVNEITEQELDKWWNDNCKRCIYSSDICMYDDE